MRGIPAELHVGSAGALLQSGLGHLEWVVFVSQSFLQGLYEHLRLENLLQGLRDARHQ